MPSTFISQVKEEKESILDDESGPLRCIESDEINTTTTSFVDDLSSNIKLLGSMKTSLSSKIKSETRKLIGHPGKATLKRSSPSEDEENLEEEIITNEDFSAFFKEHDILMEFKYVCKSPPGGVYVVPSIKSLHVWHGIIFVRAGPFKEGIFRFDILLPDNFPCSVPLVRFTSHIYHPQVHQNGLLNLEQAFPVWKKGEHHIMDILKYVKSCFYNLNTWNALNEDAVACINESLEEFKTKAHQCVEESLKKFNEQSTITSDDDGNLLKAKPLDISVVNDWRQQILYQDSL